MIITKRNKQEALQWLRRELEYLDRAERINLGYNPEWDTTKEVMSIAVTALEAYDVESE